MIQQNYQRRADTEETTQASTINDEVRFPENLQIHSLYKIHEIWKGDFQSLLYECNLSEQKEKFLRFLFEQSHPHVFSLIRKFNQKQLNYESVKKNLDHLQRIWKSIPIFTYHLQQLVLENKITQNVKKWNIQELLLQNQLVQECFIQYFQSNNEEQFAKVLSQLYDKRNGQTCKETMKKNKQHPIKQIVKQIFQNYMKNSNFDQLLQNLFLIHPSQAKKRKLKCATLNFSGIALSPFEFHDGSEEMTKLNEYMKQIVIKEEEYFKGCKFSVIDKHFCENRMSVRFGKEMILGDKLPSKKQYLEMWHKYYQKNRPAAIKDDTPEIQEKYAMFDYFCYVSIVSLVYNLKLDENHEIQGIKQLDSKEFGAFLDKMLNRPCTKLDVKQDWTMEFIEKHDIDIMFLQEGGDVDWTKKLKQDYQQINNSDSVIIFRKDKVGGISNKLQEKWKDKLNFNEDSAFFFSEHGYLLCSIHLTSKAHHTEQAQEMFSTLKEIRKQNPMMKIIVGADANHFLKESPGNFLKKVPSMEAETTSTKKRTFMQVQFKKGDVEARSIKDQILSTLAIRQHSVNVIDGSQAGKYELLPNDRHPFDHFIVIAHI